MSEWENNTGETSEWYTPPDLLVALGETYDLDPCAPVNSEHYHVRALNHYTEADDGLGQQWQGFVFMNPSYGGRNGHVPWLQKFLQHANGIAVVRAYTSAGWFHDYALKADAMLFPRGKTQFIRADGTVGKSLGHGVALLGCGHRACCAMLRSNLGLYFDLPARLR